MISLSLSYGRIDFRAYSIIFKCSRKGIAVCFACTPVSMGFYYLILWIWESIFYLGSFYIYRELLPAKWIGSLNKMLEFIVNISSKALYQAIHINECSYVRNSKLQSLLCHIKSLAKESHWNKDQEWQLL